MSKEGLKRWRLLIPGIFVLAAVAPISYILFGFKIGFDEKNFGFVCGVLIIAVLYELFDLRSTLFRAPINEVRENIRIKLLASFTDRISSEQLERLDTKQLMRVFYSLVDNDKSLTDQANDVRMNGLFLSSICDFGVIAQWAAAVYVLLFIIYWQVFQTIYPSFVIIGVILIVLRILLVPYLIKRAKRSHLELSDEQLGHITSRGELLAQLDKAIFDIAGRA